MTQQKDNLRQFWNKHQIIATEQASGYNSTTPRRMLLDDIETLLNMMDNINDEGSVQWLELIGTLREFCSIRCRGSNKVFKERYGLTVKHAYHRRIKKKEKKNG